MTSNKKIAWGIRRKFLIGKPIRSYRLLSWWSIRRKLLTTMIGLIIAILLAFTYIQISSQKEILEKELSRHIGILKKNLIERGKTLSDHLARITENDIAAHNLSNIAVVIRKTVNEIEELSYAILMDSSRMAFINTLKPEDQRQTISEPEDLFAAKQELAGINEYGKDNSSYIEFIVPIHVSAEPWGWLRLGFSQDLLNNEITKSKKDISMQIRDMFFKSVLIAVIFIFAGIGIIILISNRLSRPIVALTNSAMELATGSFWAAENIKVKSKDEVGVLSSTFVNMSKNLREYQERLKEYSRTLEYKVEKRTHELKKANEDLKHSQNQLIQSEKIASLGQLVAGVAHEINTPIGIGVTTSTHLMDITRKISTSFGTENMTRSELEEYFSMVDKASDLIFRNLHRTSELIKSFQMISADKISHEKRKFKIKVYLEDILASLRPKIKETPHRISINCDDKIEIDSYPGAFAQVITNFVINSLSHAYEDGEKGDIRIDVSSSNEKAILLKYSDDGKGIHEDSIKKIFDPFFTTRRGKGGTGLGLHIVYNIVTQTLKGRIYCESAVGKGTTFIVEIPGEV